MLVLQEIMARKLSSGLENNSKNTLAMKVLLIGNGTQYEKQNKQNNVCRNKWLVNTCGKVKGFLETSPLSITSYSFSQVMTDTYFYPTLT